MLAHNDNGDVLDADFLIVQHGGHLDLILESAGGGSGRARNPDYGKSLSVLLARLRGLAAVIEDAVVDSRDTQRVGMAPADRRLIEGPIRLADVDNIHALRRQLMSRQTRVGQAPGTRGGNSTKRIRLQLTVPGYSARDAAVLAERLASPLPVLPDLSGEAFTVDGSARTAALAVVDEPLKAKLEDVLEALRNLSLQDGPDNLAKRHQPLTLLWAIGCVRQGRPRLVSWPIARGQIAQLIRNHGRATDRANPYLPFLALASSGLWQLTAVPPTSLTGTARQRWLTNEHPPVRGGLTAPVAELFAASEEGTVKAVSVLLTDHFDPAEWDAVLSAVQLDSLARKMRSSPAQPMDTGPAKQYWWTDAPTERSWVEIRRIPQGLGQELRCPFINAVGHRDGWWELVDDVHVGDRIYHWNADQGRFIGRSITATTRKVDASTGDRFVQLRDFQPLNVDVGLEKVRALAPELEASRDSLMEQHPGSTLYLPFQFRSDGLRLMSNYFAKLPVAMQQILFGFDGLAQSDLPALPREEDQDDTEADGGQEPGGRPGGFLSPFKPRADTDYVSNIAGGPFRRSRKHETLVNDFARWLSGHGREAASNAAIDLGLVQPPVIIEAKVIRAGKWASTIREAIGQLYEYRYFQVVSPESELMILASAEIPRKWLDYLEQDRQIGAAWRATNGFQLTPRARAALGIE